MSWLWTWEWFPTNLCIGLLTIIVILCSIWMIVIFIKEIIEAIFG